MKRKRQRQTALLHLARQRGATSQLEIVRMLRKQGIAATQTSVSRDLRELGLVKVQGRYVPAARVLRVGPHPPAEGPLHELITQAEPVGANLIVVRTRVGAANAVAAELDETHAPDIAGTLAGDDTIFVAVRSRSAQGRVLAMLNQLTLSA